jgi:hypothetical protein
MFRKYKREKGFTKKKVFNRIGLAAQFPFPPFFLRRSSEAAQANLPVRRLHPRDEAARWRCRGHPMPPPSPRWMPPPSPAYKYPNATAGKALAATPPFFSLSRAPANPSPSRYHGRRLTPPFRAAPSSSEVPSSSASSLGASPLKESSRSDWDHRHRRRFSPQPPRASPLIPPPPASLRPRRPRRCLPGEALVLLDPSPSISHTVSPSTAGHRRRLGAGRAGPLPQPTWPAWLPAWRPGPPVSDRGSNDPCAKSSLQLFLFLGEFQKSVESCKKHRKLSVCQKNANDLSKCLEKWDLHFGIKIMHC